MRRILFFFGFLLIAACSPNFALATDGGHDSFSGLPGLYGYGYSGNLYGLGRIPVPPYFALHPPVYYSAPQARPYGISPFAHRRAPLEVQTVKPVAIINPFVRKHEQASPAPKATKQDKVTSRGEVIVNPFVAAPLQVARD